MKELLYLQSQYLKGLQHFAEKKVERSEDTK